jgi:hypothetical protein
MGDMTRPARINTFVNDLHNGFRLLNLKNDNLRKKCVPCPVRFNCFPSPQQLGLASPPTEPLALPQV